MADLDPTRAYYDEFAAAYEAQRRPADPHGYHAMIDDLEVAITKRYARGKDLLEVGCGTGLLLERFRSFAGNAKGIDLSPRMLDRAKARGLDVREGSATKLPFGDAEFDVTVSFKVLAHVDDIGRALSEMARVTRPGGIVLAEFYNPFSFRGLLKRIGPPGKISRFTKEDAVYTRFDAPWVIPRLLPARTTFERGYGVRIVTPAASAMRLPFAKRILPRLEHMLSATPAAYLAGFYVAAIRKN
jgi:ubiquinone/menaquinone biosynthesis C-methylase UbiE